ncbi:hypothetical protein AA15237_2686 [Komagataeibacter xylinus NBRC 15237]|nr:hypothetical protein AA16663_2602 [Komagataeibacter rhaeticus DSM 16663]GBQ78054.1 hypothetical protein AA15237_2686 [Komagataeibacter xylinus NBRC 15237]
MDLRFRFQLGAGFRLFPQIPQSDLMIAKYAVNDYNAVIA